MPIGSSKAFRFNWQGGLLQDIRFGLRMLLKSPGFTATAVLSLALGIGANIAIFSALNAVLLRSLPVRNPHELRLINWTGQNPLLNGYTGPGISGKPGGIQMGTSFPYPTFRNIQDRAQGFSDVFAYFAVGRVTAIARGEASIAGMLLVSGNFFSGYGANPLIGRPLLPKDDLPGAPPVVVITHRWWERHFELDPRVLGQSVTLNKTSYTVVGVLPRRYAGPMPGDPTDIYVPMSSQPPPVSKNRSLDSPNCWWVQIMGRLAPGANEAQAQASLAVLFRQALGESDSKMDQPGILLQDGSSGPLMLRQQLARPFIALTAVVGLVLLIACVNLAGLLLARGGSRQHEMAVRAALGAGRWRLIRQSLTESLVLSLIGGCLGLLVAVWVNPLMLGFLTKLPDGFHFDLRTDSNVLTFTLAISLLTALVFGLLPAARSSQVDLIAGLKCQSAKVVPRMHLGKVLVVIQVALSVLLVIGAGLMMQSFGKLCRLDPGFDPENVLLFRLDPGQAGYKNQQLTAFYDQALSAIAAIPGVRSVAFSDIALASGSSSSEDIAFPGREKKPGDNWHCSILTVSEGFFKTMSIPLVLGREFNAQDSGDGSPAALVNEAFAQRYFPGEHPLGQTFILQDRPERVFQVVGLCRDAKYEQMRGDVSPIVYLSQRQRAKGGVTFEVRSLMQPLAMVPAVRKAIAALDPELPISRIITQKQQIEQSIASDRLFASLSSLLALLVVLLASIGLHGLIAYNLARRTREIGIRIAIGATPADVVRPILMEAVRLTLIGLAVGVSSALALMRLIKSQLYGVTPADPTTLIGASLILIAVAIISAWVPALRAMRINPIEALHSD